MTKQPIIHILTDNGQDPKDKWDECIRRDFDNLFRKDGFSCDDPNIGVYKTHYYDILEQGILDEVWVSYKATSDEPERWRNGAYGIMAYRSGDLYGCHDMSWLIYSPILENEGSVFSNFELSLDSFDNFHFKLTYAPSFKFCKEKNEHLNYVLEQMNLQYPDKILI